MFRLILLFFTALALPVGADSLSRVDIEMCSNGCIAEVLAGQREVTDCVLLPLATRQIVGPPARTKSDADLQPIVEVVERVLQERLNRYASDFVGAQIEINHVQPSARQPDVYGVGRLGASTSGWRLRILRQRTISKYYRLSPLYLGCRSNQCQPMVA
ncbi:MAG: hypothetical protein ACK42D_00895 [Candidatus Paceibacteria bacterium]